MRAYNSSIYVLLFHMVLTKDLKMMLLYYFICHFCMELSVQFIHIIVKLSMTYCLFAAYMNGYKSYHLYVQFIHII